MSLLFGSFTNGTIAESVLILNKSQETDQGCAKRKPDFPTYARKTSTTKAKTCTRSKRSWTRKQTRKALCT